MKRLFKIFLMLIILIALSHCPYAIREQHNTNIDAEEAQIEEQRRVADEDMQRQADEEEDQRRLEEVLKRRRINGVGKTMNNFAKEHGHDETGNSRRQVWTSA